MIVFEHQEKKEKLISIYKEIVFFILQSTEQILHYHKKFLDLNNFISCTGYIIFGIKIPGYVVQIVNYNC